ncbi:CoA transferase [Burkholderia pyrrocinia]|uniref:CaiB/BaiF CoA transferase family protein n=1 Tax=Burkholderia pyrrocinia TaxID=60550 RepID=UPI002AAF8617|nr:CoA transferase [Burkholderia pyrrocinia]
MSAPLRGIKVVDLSTLLPGPLCTLLLAEAGADVVKIERPRGGDEMRSYVPKAGPDSVNFGMLNRGKRSVALDLKSVAGREAALALIDEADVLVEQFRPGVMSRLGLGYEQVTERNPRIVYCSITGYGQRGPKADVAAHDLNYLAETGMLALSCDADGAPVLPPALIADVGGGAYPAVINILLALKQRDATGDGCWLDISMADNLFPFMYWALGNGMTGNGWPNSGDELVTGGTARYQIYRTLDDQFLAAAPLEEKFWTNFTHVIGAPELATKTGSEPGVRERVAELISGATADTWVARFAETDTCTVRVVPLEQAVKDPHFRGHGLFDRKVRMPGGRVIDALPVPIVDAFRGDESIRDAPALDNP